MELSSSSGSAELGSTVKLTHNLPFGKTGNAAPFSSRISNSILVNFFISVGAVNVAVTGPTSPALRVNDG
ncbi:hypothetical protein BGP_4411 [Beggiatoa sp. PS]|nr:hypothetical protein BGP_4411 [Beggiatoa sp. PS]